MDWEGYLADLTDRQRGQFQQTQRIKSLAQYLRDVAGEPLRLTRNAAQYVLDMLDHYGERQVEALGQPRRRLVLFDAPFDGGRNPLVGQEPVQHEFHQALKNFVREGHPDKLILLHGPNASSKSTFVDLLFRGLDHYSQLPEGVLYRFNWIFPTKEAIGREVGFGTRQPPLSGLEDDRFPSYAFLDEPDIAVHIQCELKDPPFFLLPQEERAQFLKQATGLGNLEDRFSRWTLEGDLCPKCKTIHDSLFNTYQGNLAKVFQHVQVERLFLSRRYRCGAVTITPKMHVDAAEILYSRDASVLNLPPSLQNLRLFEPIGDLVDANLGVIEYSDLLKRPLEANTYLLTTCEKQTVDLDHSTLLLNLVMVASSNEDHLEGLKQSPLFTSFKGRFQLVTVPYLLDYTQEREIYQDQIARMRRIKHIAPHTDALASLWAVLTRLQKPAPERYPEELRPVVAKLTPLQKALLYAGERAPLTLAAELRKESTRLVEALLAEYQDQTSYEGRYGASAREVKELLARGLYNPAFKCLTAQALFQELRELVRDKSLYRFLNIEPADEYHDTERFITTLETVYTDLIDDEVRDSMDLVLEEEYLRMFIRYLQHITALIRNERVINPTTGESEEPDRPLIERMERIIAPEGDAARFRETIIGQIGAFRLDHPEEAIDYARLFPELIDRLKDDFYQQRRKVVERIETNLVKYNTDEFPLLDKELQEKITTTLTKMTAKYGYCEFCAKDAILFLIKRRYT